MRAGMRGVVGALVVLATVAVGVPAASAGAYNVVACNAPGAHGVNNSWSWAVEVLPLDGRPRRRRIRPPTPSAATVPALTASGAARTLAIAPIRWGTGANFTFQAPADTTSRGSRSGDIGVGRLGADDPSSPDNESGRFEINANFGGDAFRRSDAIRATASTPTRARSARPASRRLEGRPRRSRRRASRSGSSAAATTGPHRVLHERRIRRPVRLHRSPGCPGDTSRTPSPRASRRAAR